MIWKELLNEEYEWWVISGRIDSIQINNEVILVRNKRKDGGSHEIFENF